MKVLIVDDEYFICELLQEYLSGLGHEVTVATESSAALELFQSLRPQAVLLDIRMPGMTGIEVLRQIRQIDDAARVIMLSAFGESGTVEEAFDSGAYRYLQKPMELDRLRDMLDQMEADAAGGRGSG